MHNWRFLLLAFVAVFQPIAPYAEGLVDGRQQRCDLRTASQRRDPGLYFHGTHRFTKPLDARSLSQRDAGAVRHNELREETLRSIKSPERRLVDTLESRGKTSRLGRSTQAENRLAIDNIILRRDTRWLQFRSGDRNQRNREIERDRPAIASETRRDRLEKGRHSNKLDDDETRINSRRSIASRTSMESRRDAERYRDSKRVQEIRVARAVSEREREDLTFSSRLGRERSQEMRRAEFRVQEARNIERQILNQRSRTTEPRSSSFSSVRVYRAYNDEDSLRDTQSLDRDERLNTRSRRSIDGNRRQLDSRVTSQDRVLAEQKIMRDSPERTEHRRDLGERDARQLGRQRFVQERNAGWDRNTRLTRATLLVANRVLRNLPTDALLDQRAQSAENRRNARDIQNMELNFRSGERSIENQRASRLADRESFTENRREIRNINRESRVVTRNRAAVNDRKVHNIVRESREIRDEADKENECSFNRARSTERRTTGQDFERVSRILPARRGAQNQNEIRNTERDTRVLGRERAEIKRNVDRDSRIFGRDRTTERNIRMNLVDVHSARKEPSLENRKNNRHAEFQRMRAQRSNQRDIRNSERVSSSLERVINHLDTRDNVRQSRTIEKRASSETRANRDPQRDFRTATLEGRRDSRNVERHSRQIGDKLIIDNLRTTRFVDSDSSRRKRSAESRREIRQVIDSLRSNRFVDRDSARRERSAESRREIRQVIDSLRSNRFVDRDSARRERSAESRREIRQVIDSLRSNRFVDRDSARRERSAESRREIRQVIDNLRTTHFVDRESARRERSADSRRDIRQVQFPQVTVNSRERAAENSRVIRNIDRDSRTFRTMTARTASRVDTDNVRDYHLKERENPRVAERLNMRDARRSRSVREPSMEARRNSERNNFEIELREAESRYRYNLELAGKRDFFNAIQNTQTESETSSMNWQYLLYTLQGVYICGILMQLMNERTTGKKPRSLSWYSTPRHLIKVD